MHADLLLLVDGRFPAGGHAYSAGVEAAVAIGDVVDTATLERYMAGRVATSGTVDAAFAAAACAAAVNGAELDHLGRLDVEYSARVPSPHLRATSRRLGRQFVRAARPIWPHRMLDALATVEEGGHQPIVLGVAVGAAGGSPADASAISQHHLTAAVASAGVRLLGLDPIELAAVQARVARTSAVTSFDVARWVAADPSHLPATGGLLTEILGEQHGRRTARLFVA